MKKFNTALKGILMSLTTLAVGFLALAIPFKLFTGLNQRDMQIMFVLEISVYFVCGIIYLIIKDRREKEKAKEQERRFQKRLKFEQAQKEYYDLAA